MVKTFSGFYIVETFSGVFKSGENVYRYIHIHRSFELSQFQNFSQLSRNQMSVASSSSDLQAVRPPRRQTKPMSLMHDDAEEEVQSDGDDEVQIISSTVVPFNPDEWILNSPEMKVLAKELVGDKPTHLSNWNHTKARGDAVKAITQLTWDSSCSLSLAKGSLSKPITAALMDVQGRIIRMLCNRIISLERKRTEPLALILRDKYLFGKAKRSWNKSVASTATASPSASACSPSNGNANIISPTRTQIADIRARRFQRGAAAGAGAGGACDQ